MESYSHNMINEDVVLLAEQFKALKLHAARGGREVSRVLRSIIEKSNAATVIELLEETHENLTYLLPSLPPYAPPLNSINTVLACLEEAVQTNMGVLDVKMRLKEDNADENSSTQNASLIAETLMNILPDGARIYTHTLSETILNTLINLQRLKKISSVFVTESRPNNDGWETARRLAEHGVDVSLTIDAAMPLVIGKADCMLSGAEIIHRDGSVVGKVGALPAAILCKVASIPVNIIADTAKISLFDHFPEYLTPFYPEDLGIEPANNAVKVVGSYFDRTPAEYISAFITEKGRVLSENIASLAPTVPLSAWLCEWLKTQITA